METIAEFLSHAAAWTARNSLAASLLAGFVLVITRFLGGRLHPRLIALLWVLVGIRLVLPETPASSFSVFQFMPTVAAVESAPLPAADYVNSRSPMPSLTADAKIPAFTPLPSQTVSIPWLNLLALTWALVGAGVILRALLRQRVLAREMRKLPAVTDPDLLRNLRQCAREAGITPGFHFVIAPAGSGVAVFGFLRVTHLVVPRDFTGRYSAAEIRGILLHELAHVRRHDLLWNWATLVIQSFHWFNPLVWIAGRRFLAVRESLCDRDAVSHLRGHERRTYGAALIKALEVARLPQPRTPHPALAPFFTPSSELKHRLTMILKPQSTPLSIQLTVIAMAAAAGLVTFTTASVADEEGRNREGDAPRERESERSERPERSEGSERSREGEPRRGEGEGTTRESARDGEKSSRESEGSTTATRDGQVKINVMRDGVSVNGKQVSLVNLRRELDGVTAKSAVLMADRGVPYQTVETVVTALKGSGIQEIAFGSAEGESGTAREGDGAPRSGPRDGEGASKTGPRDGDMKREGTREGDAPRTGPRDGEDERPAGTREGDASRSGPRDGEGASKTGPRDGEGAKSTGPRDGEMKREGTREGDAPRSGPRDGEAERSAESREGGASGMDERQLAQATRVYRVYDKDGDNSVTFEEWLAMKNGEMTSDRKATEKGWFDQADGSRDGKVTLGEWLDWQANRGRDQG